jgi:CRISPR-associated protein Cas2
MVVIIMYIILVYDITLDNGGSRILRNVYKTCKRYLTHIQNSVFEGEINKAKLEKLRVELGDYIRKDKDSVIVFKSRQQRWLDKDFWGIEDDSTSNFF